MSAHAIHCLMLFYILFESAFLLQGATAQIQTASSTSQLATRTSKHIEVTETLSLGPYANMTDKFAGAVIAADPCMTTYRLGCTAGFGNTEGFCFPSPWTVCLRQTFRAFYSADGFAKMQVTYGPGTWIFSSQTSQTWYGANETTTFIQACGLQGTTKAFCSATNIFETSGSKSGWSATTTLSGDEVVFGPVAITAGVVKLSGANTASCTLANSAAAATAITEVYKLMIIPGAIALLRSL